MISAIVSRVVILLFGTLYPAYASYKAVRTKNVKEYVKWMMYWIVFALFTCAETFTDLFLSFWFPFYYELKVIIVIWLLSPATKGSSILYRNFVHPALTKKEQDIDEYISKAKEQGYHTMLQLGSKGVNYATSVIMQTAIKGGGGIVNHLRRSYSLSDLSDNSDVNSNNKAQDTVDSSEVPRELRQRIQRKTAGGSHVDLYFPEMDVDVRSHPHEHPSIGQIRSTEDISSGYSSAEPLFAETQVIPEGGGPLTRTASVGGTRGRTTRATRVTTQPRKPGTAEGEEGGLDFDFGWPHSPSLPLPPMALTSLIPELLNLDPAMPPEHLQMILNNIAYSAQRETLPHIYETNYEIENQQRETILPNQSLGPVIKEGNEEISLITEPKENESSETLNRETPPVPKEEIETPVVMPREENFIEVSNQDSTVVFEEKPAASPSTDENDKEQENKRISECFEDAADEIKHGELEDTAINKEPTIEIVQNTVQSNITEIAKCENENEQDNKRLSECFEDANDDMVLPTVVNLEQINVSQTENLQRSASKESVASIDDQCFEDSLPEVVTVSRSDSLSTSEDRKGKYHKGRAPPPPDGRKSVELSHPNEHSSNQNTTDISIKNDHSARPSTPSGIKSKAEDLKEDAFKPAKMSYEPKVNPPSKLSTPNYDRRETSPSPSVKSKKDSSALSRFLPKSSMSSIFNLWGSKDGGNKSGTPMVRPSSPSNFQSTGQYDPNPSHSKTDESSKMLIRQMSHSPSRRKHGTFD